MPKLEAISARFYVGAFIVEQSQNCLKLNGRKFAVEPLVMDVLCFLAKRPDEVVARDELINHIWYFNPGADESLTRAVSLLRRVFKNDVSNTAYIETVWKRGYRLGAPVKDGPAKKFVHPIHLSAVRGDPNYSIAVVGLENMSALENDVFLADGISRDLAIRLSRVPRLRVAPFSSSVKYRGADAQQAEVAAELKVRYILSGSLSRLEDQILLRLFLVDAKTNTQVWSDKKKLEFRQLLDVQDEVIQGISTTISSALKLSNVDAQQTKRTLDLTAYELVQRAEALRLNYCRETAFEIIALLNEALLIDPSDAAVHAALAIQHIQNVVSRFEGTPLDSFEIAKKHLSEAIRLSPQDPEVLLAAGITACMMGNAGLAVRQLTRSYSIDPNNAHTLAVLGWQSCWLNNDPLGLRMIETAEELAPHHPRFPVWAHYRGHCAIRLGQIEAAIDAYQDCFDRNPNYSLNIVTLAMAQGLNGQMEEARATIRKLLEVSPHYALEEYEKLATYMTYWFPDKTTRERSVAVLKAAWPPLSN